MTSATTTDRLMIGCPGLAALVTGFLSCIGYLLSQMPCGVIWPAAAASRWALP